MKYSAIISILLPVGLIAGLLAWSPTRDIFLQGLTSLSGAVTNAVTTIEPSREQSEQGLQEENAALKAELSSLMYLKQENELLKSALETRETTALTPVKAKVVGFDNNFLRHSALVNIGSNQGVEVNQPAIYLGYLVGKVVSVYENSPLAGETN